MTAVPDGAGFRFSACDPRLLLVTTPTQLRIGEVTGALHSARARREAADMPDFIVGFDPLAPGHDQRCIVRGEGGERRPPTQDQRIADMRVRGEEGGHGAEVMSPRRPTAGKVRSQERFQALPHMSLNDTDLLLVDKPMHRLLACDRLLYRLENGWSLHFRGGAGLARAGQPRGTRYALTLHDVDGMRLLGFDNAHAVQRAQAYYHRHRFRRTSELFAYEFRGADELICDVFDRVETGLPAGRRGVRVRGRGCRGRGGER